MDVEQYGFELLGPLICDYFSVNLLDKVFGDLEQFEKTCQQCSIEIPKRKEKVSYCENMMDST